jgi:hypothetical protein
VCDEDGNVVVILARMEFERVVEHRASIERQALQQFAEAATPSSMSSARGSSRPSV